MLPLWKITKKTEDRFQQAVRSLLVERYGEKQAYYTLLEIRQIPRLADRCDFYEAITADCLDGIYKGYDVRTRISQIGEKYHSSPVGPEEFLMGNYFLGKAEEVYPKLIPYFVEMNSGKYQEAVLTGAIGVAKSSMAIWTTAYQLYLLSCYKDPHKLKIMYPIK